MRDHAERRGRDHHEVSGRAAVPGRASGSQHDTHGAAPGAYAPSRFWPSLDRDRDAAPDEAADEHAAQDEVHAIAEEQSFDTTNEPDEVDSVDGDDVEPDEDDGAPRMIAASGAAASDEPSPQKEGCACGTCSTCDAKKASTRAANTKQAAPAPGKNIWFQESRKRLEKTVPIDKGGDVWKSIFSAKLDDVPAEELAARGEVQLTKCQASDVKNGECRRATPFTPSYKTKIIVADSESATDGDPVADAGKATSCNDTAHHCPSAVPQGRLSGVASNKFVNLVVAAGTNSNKLNGKDRMYVDPDHGSVDVTRWRAGATLDTDDAKGKRTGKKPHATQASDFTKRKPQMTLQAKITAEPGDIIDADATIKVKAIAASGRPKGNAGKHANCTGAREPLVSHQIYVSKTKNALGSKIATLTAKNGSNIALGKSHTYKKSGAARLPNKPKQVPDTVYVTVVSAAGRSCAAPGDKWQVLSGSTLSVRRQRA